MNKEIFSILFPKKFENLKMISTINPISNPCILVKKKKFVLKIDRSCLGINPITDCPIPNLESEINTATFACVRTKTPLCSTPRSPI